MSITDAADPLVKALGPALTMAGAMAGQSTIIWLHNELVHIISRLCQHRWVAFAGIVGFRNKAGPAELTNWVSPSSNRIAFGRGTQFIDRIARGHLLMFL